MTLRPPYFDSGWAQLLARSPLPRKALFLDRDGVINVNHGYVHTPERTEWVPGIFDLVAAAQRSGYLVVVVTNQAGIGRGYYDEDAFLRYTAWVHAQFAAKGTPLLATYWCPHHPDAGLGSYRAACSCRKPEAGMLLGAMHAFDIEPGASLMLGDSETDLKAARAAGVRARLVPGDRLGPDLLGASLDAIRSQEHR